MPLMEWTEKLSVGVKQFDAEHQKLVGMVNDLFDAVQAGKGKDLLGPILDGLISYTKTHFANEEKYFAQHQYPNFQAHKAEHDALAKQVLDVQAKFKAGASAALSMEVMNFLKNWLVKHILGTDKAYGPFLNGKGIK
jgi:hemerythrin